MAKKSAGETLVTRGFGTSVPAEVRRSLGIEPGDHLVWEIAGSGAHLKVKKAGRRGFADFTPYDFGFATNATEEHDEVF